MRKLNLIWSIVAMTISLAFCAGAIAQDKMETRDTRIGKLVFENGYPNHETLEKLYDERDFQRASQAYI